MALDLPESDWKAFKKLREVALERLCERILKGVGPITTDNSKSFHARYLSLFEFIQEQDDHIARAFNNPRRSTAVMQLVAMATLDLVKPEELSAFTPRTQAVVEALSKPDRGAHARKGA